MNTLDLEFNIVRMLPSFFFLVNTVGKKSSCSLSHTVITPFCKSLFLFHLIYKECYGHSHLWVHNQSQF